MNFYVYESDSKKQVRVHAGSCIYCKEGENTYRSISPTNRWHGPYETLAQAQAFAKSLESREIRACRTCLPKVKPVYTW
jgi:F-type H+/Na+-transporting ATPase subunit beta